MKRGRLHIAESDRRRLVAWTHAGTTPQRVARRARIVLLVAEGRAARDVAARLGVSTRSVALWKARFRAGGPGALLRDASGRGRKATVSARARIQLRALLVTPPAGRRWTVRALASALGVSAASVHRLLKADKLTIGAEPRPRHPRTK